MDLETVSDSAIPRQSLTSAVAEKLRDQIIRGEIQEGAQLRQDAIATQYQVSRIPVREALRQLDAEGLIAIVPNRGAVVPALSPNDIEELFSIRALLEPEVLKLSIPHLTEEDFSEAEAVLRKYVSELRREDHVSAWGRLNWQFHSILYSRANQPRFMAIHSPAAVPDARHETRQRRASQDAGIVSPARGDRGLQATPPAYPIRRRVLKAGPRAKTNRSPSR